MADEDSFGIEITFQLLGKGGADEIFNEAKGEIFSMGDAEACIRSGCRADERNSLKVSSIVPTGLHAFQSQLRRNVVSGELLAAGADAAAFQLVTSKIFHMSANFFSGNMKSL